MAQKRAFLPENTCKLFPAGNTNMIYPLTMAQKKALPVTAGRGIIRQVFCGGVP